MKSLASSILTLIFGTGLGSTLTIHFQTMFDMITDVNQAMLFGVYFITIVVGAVKVFYTIKNKGEK